MKFNVTLHSASKLEEIENYWDNKDYVNLLELFGFPEAETVQTENLREMLFMAVNDFEPNEAAKIVLTYKLSDNLSDGQIDQISNDMLIDKVSEEYPEIDLHYDLFNINQLLFKAFNGKFPNAKATKVDFELISANGGEEEITKEIVLKALNNGLSESNLIKRLFPEQMTTGQHFEEAENILWKLDKKSDSNYTFLTSEYWLNKDELIASEFEAEFSFVEKEEDH